MTLYPVEVPLFEIRKIIQIVKEGSYVEKRADFAHAIWVVQGYAQSKLLGNPETQLLAYSEANGLAELEKIVAWCDSQGEKEITAQSGLDWYAIVLWLLNELTKLLVNK